MLFFKQSTDLLAEAVRFELTAPYGTTVFKTAALNRAQPHFLNWYPGRDLNPQQNCLLNSRVYLIVCATGILFGVPYQYRSGTTAFTEQGAGHYTKDTIDSASFSCVRKTSKPRSGSPSPVSPWRMLNTR